ncbi:MAG TPA: oxygenase MpaB family protein [Pyrinomonadaceae bacterium]|nr:oxygenase MpaB family protein [Pyrinomonadaceae bacterium]
MSDFVHKSSIVRRIWGDPDLILLIFAGSAAEFALNRAVDWLFFTGKIPGDPIGRLFSTVRYAQEIVFVSEETAQRTIDRINASHGSVEQQRNATIPEWAFRDVLYMLVDYSERAHALLYRPLSASERNEVYSVFLRIGEGLKIKELPRTYEEWKVDRPRHLVRDLTYSRHTSLLYRQYRVHLGAWRYYLLLQVQALLVPDQVRRMLRLKSNDFIAGLVQTYGVVTALNLQSVVHTLLIPPRYWAQLKQFDKIGARSVGVPCL